MELLNVETQFETSTVEAFRADIKTLDNDEIAEKWLLSPGALMVRKESIEFISERLVSAYGISSDDIWVGITGSAKIGFSLIEKRKEGETMNRYRSFGIDSDIDVAVISPKIFDRIWRELSTYSHGYTYFPWRANRLGDYLVCGWLRPDHFPRNSRLSNCDTWLDTFRDLSANPLFERHQVRGGLFNSRIELKRYMTRAISQCRLAEEIS